MKSIHEYRIPEEFDPAHSDLCLMTWCEGCEHHYVTCCDCGECTLIDFCDGCEQCEQCELCCECNTMELELSTTRYDGERPVTEHRIKYGDDLFIIYDYDALSYAYTFIAPSYRKVIKPNAFEVLSYIMEIIRTD